MSASSQSGAAFETDEAWQRTHEANNDETMAMDDPIEDVVLDASVADPIEHVDAANRDNEIVDSQIHSLAISYMAEKAAIKRSTFQAFRSLHPAESTEELARRWVNHVTGVQQEPRPAKIEQAQEDGNKRLPEYMKCICSQDDRQLRQRTLDCTFCSLRFPAYFLLDIAPEYLENWRSVSYRCCFQCGTAANDDFPWYADHPKLSPALNNKLGAAAEPEGSTFGNTDRFTMTPEDADYRLRPCGRKTAINTEHKYAHKAQGLRGIQVGHTQATPMVLLEENERPIAVNDWYRICQKVSNGRRAAAKGYLRKREAPTPWCFEISHARDRPETNPGALRSHDGGHHGARPRGQDTRHVGVLWLGSFCGCSSNRPRLPDRPVLGSRGEAVSD